MITIKQLAGPLAISSVLMAAQAAMAGPIDTYLTGIGVAVPNAVTAANSGNAAWAPSSAGVAFTSEDSVASNGFVGPGYGGQGYDLEALYVQRVGSNLVITGISGANLAAMPVGASGNCASGSPCNTFPIGDFFLGTGTVANFNPVVGIEVTGQHYTMDGNGYTSGWTSPLTAGSVVDVNGADVVNGGFERGLAAWSYVGSPSQIAAAGYTGQSALRTGAVTWETINGHAAFQAVVDTQFLGSVIASDYVVHWGELCGNDFLRTAVNVPEPNSLLLLAVGLIGALVLRGSRRRWPAK
jgi:hypothetical protein